MKVLELSYEAIEKLSYYLAWVFVPDLVIAVREIANDRSKEGES